MKIKLKSNTKNLGQPIYRKNIFKRFLFGIILIIAAILLLKKIY